MVMLHGISNIGFVMPAQMVNAEFGFYDMPSVCACMQPDSYLTCSVSQPDLGSGCPALDKSIVAQHPGREDPAVLKEIAQEVTAVVGDETEVVDAEEPTAAHADAQAAQTKFLKTIEALTVVMFVSLLSPNKRNAQVLKFNELLISKRPEVLLGLARLIYSEAGLRTVMDVEGSEFDLAKKVLRQVGKVETTLAEMAKAVFDVIAFSTIRRLLIDESVKGQMTERDAHLTFAILYLCKEIKGANWQLAFNNLGKSVRAARFADDSLASVKTSIHKEKITLLNGFVSERPRDAYMQIKGELAHYPDALGYLLVLAYVYDDARAAMVIRNLLALNSSHKAKVLRYLNLFAS